MIDLENAKKEFVIYTSQFNTKEINIQRKIGHSIRVMEISKKIATKIGLDEEEVQLATLIGLLHDIARFEQFTKYHTFRDRESIDHGKYGVELLEQNNTLRKYIKEEKYDTIIKKAIRNHNQYGFIENLNEKELMFSKIIKDADKIDILYQGTQMFWKKNEEKEDIKNSQISKEVWEQWKEGKLIENKFKNNSLDYLIGMISFIYDIFLEESKAIIKEIDYYNKILDGPEYNDETKEKIKEIKEVINQKG